MPEVKISVIIPNYNHASYLRQRIDSVLNQTYRNIEVIILDDCSTDESRSIIDSYRSSPVVTHVVINTSNTGSPFKQWQKGISLATGEWIWIAESDDYADEYFLEKMLDAVENNEKAGLVYCDSWIVNNDKVSPETFAAIKNKRFKTDRWSSGYSNRGVREVEDYLLHEGTINNTSAVLFRKKILMETNPFDIDLKYIGDKYAFVKVLSVSDIVYVKESLNYYRDPFNTKHTDRFVYYFYEQFLVFDWALRHMEITDRKKFFEGFYANTRNSLFRGWDGSKIELYIKLFRVNRSLLMKSISYNFGEGLRSVFSVFKSTANS